VRLPPANPAEEAELYNYMIANHWHQWHYTGRKLYSAGTVQISGIDVGMVNARLKSVFGAWPLPGEYGVGAWPYGAPANAVSVQQFPT
jgi:hypothetical protein